MAELPSFCSYWIMLDCGNSDHEACVKALLAGLLRRSADKPSFYIHLSGMGTLCDQFEGTHFGTLNPKVYSDIDDLDYITSLPDFVWHRITDNVIQTTADAHGEHLKCAIVCPGDVYGKGRGLGRTQSMFLPVFQDEALRLGATFYTGEGTNTRSWVHIEDVVQVFLKLVEAAVAGGGNATWGREVGIRLLLLRHPTRGLIPFHFVGILLCIHLRDVANRTRSSRRQDLTQQGAHRKF
jgi:hypothetical protein